jgi:hypothetical protein
MMKKAQHHPNFIQIISTLVPLLRQYPSLSVMQFDDLCDWMSWYWNRGTMAWWISDSGEPRGVCLIKLFRRMEQFLDRDVHEPCAKFCFIELSIAADPIIMGLMFNELVERWGPQDIMMWDRPGRTENGAPRMYKWLDFCKLARRLSYGYVHA